MDPERNHLFMLAVVMKDHIVRDSAFSQGQLVEIYRELKYSVYRDKYTMRVEKQLKSALTVVQDKMRNLFFPLKQLNRVKNKIR